MQDACQAHAKHIYNRYQALTTLTENSTHIFQYKNDTFLIKYIDKYPIEDANYTCMVKKWLRSLVRDSTPIRTSSYRKFIWFLNYVIFGKIEELLKRLRRKHSPEFKSRVAFEAFGGLKTFSEIAAEFEVHPAMVSNWKKEMVASGVCQYSCRIDP